MQSKHALVNNVRGVIITGSIISSLGNKRFNSLVKDFTTPYCIDDVFMVITMTFGSFTHHLNFRLYELVVGMSIKVDYLLCNCSTTDFFF